MSRLLPVVVRARAVDLERFSTLWVESRVAAGQSAEAARRIAFEGRVGEALGREDVAVFVAKLDDEPVGFVVATTAELSGMSDETPVWIEQIYVRPSVRKHGVGRALMTQVTRWSQQNGSHYMVSCVPSADRDSNRYFARLGFTTFATLRATTVASLGRRLAGDDKVVAPVLRRRRTMRARARASA